MISKNIETWTEQEKKNFEEYLRKLDRESKYLVGKIFKERRESK